MHMLFSQQTELKDRYSKMEKDLLWYVFTVEMYILTYTCTHTHTRTHAHTHTHMHAHTS